MSASVEIEYIYSAWCPDCAWGEGAITTTEMEATLMARRHNADEHRGPTDE